MPDFSIEYDATSKRWVPTDIRVRMLARDQNGQYNPCDFYQPEFVCEPSGWLSFVVQDQGEIVAATVAVTDQFANYNSPDKFTKPVRVKIKALPVVSDSTQLEPLTTECNIYVAEPAQAMGYTVSPDDCWKDSEVWLLADGQSSCALTVWVEQVDAATGEVFRAPDEDFEYRLESTFDEETIVCAELDKGILPPVSNWRSARPMTDLKDPLRGKLIIKAFSRIKPSDKPTGKLEIPLVLSPSRIAIEATFLPELPARPGQEIAVRIKLRQEARNEPLANAPVQFVWDKVSQSSPLGSILTETGKTDSEGYVELRYAAPPELAYKPKQRFYDEIKILLGDGKKAVPLEKTVVIPVVPSVKLACVAEKKGLIQDPAVESIEITPDQMTGSEIRGNLVIPVEMPGGPRKFFGVVGARFSLAVGEDATPGPQQTSAAKGLWALKLPEIEEAFKKAEIKSIPLLLSSDPEKKQVFLMLLDQEQEARIKGYEDDLTTDRLRLFSADFQKKLQYYRYHFCSQLAAKKEDDIDLAIAGVQLMIVAVKGSDSFFRRFKGHEDLVKSRFEGLMSSLIAIALNSLQGGKKLQQAGSSFAKESRRILNWLAKSRFGSWIARGASWMGDFASSLGDKATKQIVPLLQKIRGGINAFLEGLGKFGARLAKTIGGLLDDLVKVVDDLAAALSSKIAAFREMLANSTKHWDELVAWANKAKGAADDAVETASGWVSSFTTAIQELFQAVIDIAASLFTRLGKMIYQLSSAFIGWACQKAKGLASWVLDWLYKHSDQVKNEVERILKATKTQDEISENGIEKVLDALIAEFVKDYTEDPDKNDIKDLGMKNIKMKFDVLGRQPNQVVGNLYKYATNQWLPRDWEPVRRNFSREIIDVSSNYGSYEIATAKIDEIMNIVSTIVTCGSLGVAMLGIIFSGGTATAPIIEAMSLVDKAFNIFKAAVVDIPQIGVSVFVMFGLVIKYDLLITGLCFGETGDSA
ncbi:MAG: hypothetical protein KKB51_14050 [Candidatus Riflebacteria bacterium]|nr:hypothetical protein [Candidatus Riflebacteria bacterium]